MSIIAHSLKDVEKVVQGIDGKIKSVEVSRLTAPGENYLSLVLRVDFEVEKNGKTKMVSAVAKRIPLLEKKEIFHIVPISFEIKWYCELLPLMKEVGREFGISSNAYPEFLGSRLSLDPAKTEVDDDGLLLLANLMPEGYKNEDRLVGFDFPSTKAVLKSLAAFHAIPLIMKFKRPEIFKIFKEKVDANNFKMPPPPSSKEGEEKMKPPFEAMLYKLLEMPECRPYAERLKALKREDREGPMEQFLGPEPWNTITHTDFWVNNVLIKPIEGQEPLVKLVDFQFYTYSSLPRDLVFFLLTSVRDDIQKQHFDDLLRYYYDEITSILEKMDVPELRLSYEEYLEQVKNTAKEMETEHAIFFTTVVFGEKGMVPDFLVGEGNMMEHMEKMHENINSRQKEKILLIIELCAKRGWM